MTFQKSAITLISTIIILVLVFGFGCDTTPPVVIITTPHDGDIVSGMVNIMAEASDNMRVKAVDFIIDEIIVNTVYIAPYSHTWDTSLLPSVSTHTIQVRASDAWGNKAESDEITVAIGSEAEAQVTLTAGGEYTEEDTTYVIQKQYDEDTTLTVKYSYEISTKVTDAKATSEAGVRLYVCGELQYSHALSVRVEPGEKTFGPKEDSVKVNVTKLTPCEIYGTAWASVKTYADQPGRGSANARVAIIYISAGPE